MRRTANALFLSYPPLWGDLVALVITGKNPYMDRAFLITFNFVLVGVLALIFFSVVGRGKQEEGVFVLLGLCVVAVGATEGG